MNNKNSIEGKVLGKNVDYPSTYSPDILVAVPRKLNREQYAIKDDTLPFIGFDIWHAYELSFLLETGLPVAGLLKLIYPANSKSIVESKSLKLYLNSFNMEQFGSSSKEGIKTVESIITKDLSNLLNTSVELKIFTTYSGAHESFKGYQLLETLDGIEQDLFNKFSDSPELLKFDTTEPYELKIATNLLRSNCKITHQPDWGSAYIHIKGIKKPNLTSILKYIVSFRNENHFHEEICEMLFKRLLDTYSPSKLMVTCIYTRRGGIDICPIRATDKQLIPFSFISKDYLTRKQLRQ